MSNKCENERRNMKNKGFTEELLSGHNKKYDIDFKYIHAMYSGYTCEFEYDGKKYGFTVRSDVRSEMITKGKDKGKKKIVLIPMDELVDNALESYIDYLIFNEEEKKKKKRYDKINVKNYYLLSISDKEPCFFYDTEVGDKTLEIESYEHSGITSTYYIVNYYDKKHNVFGFSYLLKLRTLEFDGLPGTRGVYFRNVGDNCLFLDLGKDIILIRPGEQLKLCKKNIVKEKMPVPLPVGGMEIEEFEFYDKKSNK